MRDRQKGEASDRRGAAIEERGRDGYGKERRDDRGKQAEKQRR